MKRCRCHRLFVQPESEPKTFLWNTPCFTVDMMFYTSCEWKRRKQLSRLLSSHFLLLWFVLRWSAVIPSLILEFLWRKQLDRSSPVVSWLFYQQKNVSSTTSKSLALIAKWISHFSTSSAGLERTVSYWLAQTSRELHDALHVAMEDTTPSSTRH